MKINNILFCFFTYLSISAQDVSFSNLHQSVNLMSPAFSGVVNDFNTFLIYRNQWRVQSNSFKSFAGGVHARLNSKNKLFNKVGIGFNMNQDFNNSETIKIYLAQANIAYHLKLNDLNTFSTALSLGLLGVNYNSSSGTWGNQHDGLRYDSNLNNGEYSTTNTIQKMDVGFGLLYTNLIKKNNNSPSFVRFQMAYSMSHLAKSKLSQHANFFPIKNQLLLIYNQKIMKSTVISPIISFSNQFKFYNLQAGFKLVKKMNQKAKYSSPFMYEKQNEIGSFVYLSHLGNLSLGGSLAFQNCEIYLAYDYFLNRKNIANNSYSVEMGISYKLKSFNKKMIY